MNPADAPFLPLAREDLGDELNGLLARGGTSALGAALAAHTPPQGLALGVLHGFDLLERPLVAQCPAIPGEVRAARSTVPLRRAEVGCKVVLMESAEGPVILGVIESPGHAQAPAVRVEADGERYLLEAEREIVLRCGEASITLTRAGKVLIQGTYILSRSKGYNKIKGAAVDIN